MKKIVALLTAASMCLAPVSAFASDITSEELMQKNQEAAAENTSMSMNMPINFDLGLKMSVPIDAGDGTSTSMDFEMPIKVNGQYQVAMLKEPLQMSMTGNLKIESITMAGSVMFPETSMNVESYIISSEDGAKFDTYTKMDDGVNEPSWVHQQTDVGEIASMFSAESLADLDAMTLEELMPGVDFNYEVTESDTGYDLGMKIKFEDLMPVIEKAMQSESEELPENYSELMDTIVSTLGGLTMNYVIGINKDTYQMETVHCDLNDSDLSSLNEFIASMLAGSDQEMSIALSVNDCSIDATCSYNDVTEITVPADALATEVVDTAALLEN